MSKQKIAVTVDEKLVREIDRMVADKVFPSRSGAVESAIRLFEKLKKRRRLLLELDKIAPEEEIALAAEFKDADTETWPDY